MATPCHMPRGNTILFFIQGPQCKRLLDHLEELRKLIADLDDANGMLHKYLKALEALLPIVEGIFGNHLDPLWKVYLEEFERRYLDLKTVDNKAVSVTTKVGSKGTVHDSIQSRSVIKKTVITKYCLQRTIILVPS
jgi:DNA repair exonuclease SbcCD ATPase subunit